MTEYYCDTDNFATTLEGILNEVDLDIQEGLPNAIKASLKVGRKEVKANSPVKTGEYASGWATTTRGKKNNVFGEIGNKKKPGLAHLLEKGHATLGGGRVPGREHIAPAAEVTFKELEEQIEKVVDNAL